LEVRVLDLDVRVGLGEELEDPPVPLTGERVDRDLAFLPRRGHGLLPLRRGRRARAPAERQRGGAAPREPAQPTASRDPSRPIVPGLHGSGILLGPSAGRRAMRHSTERILTTHAGSLARPDDLREMLVARDERRPYDAAA